MRFDLLPFSAELIQARWEFDELPSEDLPVLAQDALELGFDGKITRRIAGLIRPRKSDLQPFVSGFLAEMGIKKTLTREQAGFLLARFVAQGIVERRIKPYDGASFIWRNVVNGLKNHPKELMPFVGHASEYEDCGSFSQNIEKTRQQIEKDIVKEAQSLLVGTSTETN
jgi:hypothetical protein